MYPIRSYLAFSVTLIALIALLAAPARADETIEVDYRGCTLNDAIRAANTNQPVGACRGGDPGHDHIYVHDTVKILEPPVEITESLAIVGDRDTSTLDGQGRFSFFHVGPGVNLHIQDLFMSNGYGTRDTGQARVDSGGRIGFSTVKVINCKGVREIVAAADSTVHIGHAASICGKMEPFNPQRPILPLPGPNDDPPDKPRNKPKQKRDRSAKSVVKPAVHTCEFLPEHILVRAAAGTRSGIQCQVIDEAGVGIQAVIDRGIIAAVDIWGYVEPGVEVCLRGQGPLVFLDAAYAPRQVSNIASSAQGNMTCAKFNRAGSLVLLSAGAASRSQILQNCTVRADDWLNLRDAPESGQILRVIPQDSYLYASTQIPAWYEVAYAGHTGWVSADFVTPIGDCD